MPTGNRVIKIREKNPLPLIIVRASVFSELSVPLVENLNLPKEKGQAAEHVPHTTGMCHWYPHMGCNPLQESMWVTKQQQKFNFFFIIGFKSLFKKKLKWCKLQVEGNTPLNCQRREPKMWHIKIAGLNPVAAFSITLEPKTLCFIAAGHDPFKQRDCHWAIHLSVVHWWCFKGGTILFCRFRIFSCPFFVRRH